MENPLVSVTILAPGIGRLAPDCAVQWSDGHALHPWQSQICEILGQEQWNSRQLPVAELLASRAEVGDHETDEKTTQRLICADPVHLRAGRDTATLVPAAMLLLTDDEADSLLVSINDFLAADGWHVYRSDACHWFLRGLDGSALLSHPPGFLAQRNTSAFLPEGEGAGRWTRLMTELQMLLHAHPVNVEREQRGLMPVNSLWFWGGAALPALNALPGVREPRPRVFGDEPFAIALARYLGLHCQPLADFDPQRTEAAVLIIDTRLEQALQGRDELAVEQARTRFVSRWVEGFEQRLQQGEVLTVQVLDEDGVRGRLDAQVLSLKNGASAAPRLTTGEFAQYLSKQARALWQLLTRQHR